MHISLGMHPDGRCNSKLGIATNKQCQDGSQRPHKMPVGFASLCMFCSDAEACYNFMHLKDQYYIHIHGEHFKYMLTDIKYLIQLALTSL